jgi:hypothetical protein
MQRSNTLTSQQQEYHELYTLKLSNTTSDLYTDSQFHPPLALKKASEQQQMCTAKLRKTGLDVHPRIQFEFTVTKHNAKSCICSKPCKKVHKHSASTDHTISIVCSRVHEVKQKPKTYTL